MIPQPTTTPTTNPPSSSSGLIIILCLLVCCCFLFLGGGGWFYSFRKIKCTCENGEPSKECTMQNMIDKCTKCDDGYKLDDDDICEEKEVDTGTGTGTGTDTSTTDTSTTDTSTTDTSTTDTSTTDSPVGKYSNYDLVGHGQCKNKTINKDPLQITIYSFDGYLAEINKPFEEHDKYCIEKCDNYDWCIGVGTFLPRNAEGNITNNRCFLHSTISKFATALDITSEDLIKNRATDAAKNKIWGTPPAIKDKLLPHIKDFTLYYSNNGSFTEGEDDTITFGLSSSYKKIQGENICYKKKNIKNTLGEDI